MTLYTDTSRRLQIASIFFHESALGRCHRCDGRITQHGVKCTVIKTETSFTSADTRVHPRVSSLTNAFMSGKVGIDRRCGCNKKSSGNELTCITVQCVYVGYVVVCVRKSGKSRDKDGNDVCAVMKANMLKQMPSLSCII